MPSLRRLANRSFAALHAATGWVAYRFGCLGASRRRYERVLQLRGACYSAYVHLGRIAFDEGDYAGWRREFEHARRTDPHRFARLRHPLELFEPRLAGTRFAVDRVALDDHRFEGSDARATWHALRPAGRGPRGRNSDVPMAPGYDPMSGAEREDASGPTPGDPVAGEEAALFGFEGSADPFAQRDDDQRDDAADEAAHSDPHASDPRGADPRGDGRPQAGDASAAPDASFTGDDFSSPSERRRFQLRRPIDRRDITRCDFDDLARRLSS